jgi:hypothetical protein
LLWQSYDDLFLLWCHLFTVRCHFLTDEILTELQGISLNDVTGRVREDRIMYRMLRSDRRQSLGEITDQFSRQFVTKISSRTVRRRLNFEG